VKYLCLGLAGVMMALPVLTASAQSTGPEIRADNRTEAREIRNGAAPDSTHPGDTGRTHIPGNNSTVQSDQGSTRMNQTGSVGSGSR
jgi:hypothetical protein